MTDDSKRQLIEMRTDTRSQSQQIARSLQGLADTDLDS
jgi:hypothetical protein